jgi:diguanylate cyclase (GGDEF)-like protein
LVLDDRLRVVRANTEAERLLAICHPEDYGKAFIDHLTDQVRDDAYARLSEAVRGQAVSFIGALPACPGRFFRFRVAPLRVDGELTGLQLLGEDVTDRLRLERELAQRQRELEVVNHQLFLASVTDDLTGVFNRGHLTERAQIEVERAKRYGRPLTCLFLDLDHFKQVNDTWGHAAGDRVLRRFARMLAEHLRSSDLVGRYGGEEFVVLLTDTDALSVHAIAEKVRNLTRSARFEDVSPDCRLTVSMGAASLGRVGVNDLESLFSAADAALYEAKNSGRDRVVYHCSMAA